MVAEIVVIPAAVVATACMAEVAVAVARVRQTEVMVVEREAAAPQIVVGARLVAAATALQM